MWVPYYQKQRDKSFGSRFGYGYKNKKLQTELFRRCGRGCVNKKGFVTQIISSTSKFMLSAIILEIPPKERFDYRTPPILFQRQNNCIKGFQ